MKDKTAKLTFVQKSIDCFKEMAEHNHQQEKDWADKGEKQIAFTCRMIAQAYEFVVKILEEDLSD